MNSTPARSICATALAVFAGLSYADPPDHIFGTYTRLTQTCGWGGPGGADRNVRDCTEVFQDRLEIAPAVDLDRSSPNRVRVSFGLHFDIGQNYFCTFRGQGVWTNGRVVLDQPKDTLNPNKADPACHLTLSLSKGTAQLLDPGQKCQPSLCIGSTNLNAVSYAKDGAQPK